jgi:hypothetical protein
MMLPPRPLALILGLALMGCQTNDLDKPPPPLGDFVLGINVAVTETAQQALLSRDVTPEELQAALTKAVADRFGRYQGSKIYNIGIAVEGYALAPPGIPVVLKPKSLLLIRVNVFDDAAGVALNPGGKRLTILEGLSPETVIGSGLTRSKEEQLAVLSYNAAKAVERYLLENPQWFPAPVSPPLAPVADAAAAP